MKSLAKHQGPSLSLNESVPWVTHKTEVAKLLTILLFSFSFFSASIRISGQHNHTTIHDIPQNKKKKNQKINRTEGQACRQASKSLLYMDNIKFQRDFCRTLISAAAFNLQASTCRVTKSMGSCYTTK